LPTLDELLGLDGMNGEGFVDLVCHRVEQGAWNVFTMHAEMEGREFQWVADRILARLKGQGVLPLPLSEVRERIRADEEASILETEILQRPIKGRAGEVAVPAGLEPAD
jgi:ABC-type uncharacterized transport system ATPase subunit